MGTSRNSAAATCAGGCMVLFGPISGGSSRFCLWQSVGSVHGRSAYGGPEVISGIIRFAGCWVEADFDALLRGGHPSDRSRCWRGWSFPIKELPVGWIFLSCGRYLPGAWGPFPTHNRPRFHASAQDLCNFARWNSLVGLCSEGLPGGC